MAWGTRLTMLLWAGAHARKCTAALFTSLNFHTFCKDGGLHDGILLQRALLTVFRLYNYVYGCITQSKWKHVIDQFAVVDWSGRRAHQGAVSRRLRSFISEALSE